MPTATPVFVEQRVVAFALGHPGFGPGRLAPELRRAKWGGIHLVVQYGPLRWRYSNGFVGVC